MSKGFKDAGRPYGGDEPRHNGHIGPGPKPGPKRAVNLSVDAEILRVAKELKINLSQALEETLRQRTEEERIRRFQEKFRPAIQAYNRFIEKHGTLSEAWLRELYGDDIYGDDEPSV